MHQALADLVHPVLYNGLALKERLERGEEADFATERGYLKGLLLTEVEAQRVPDFGGDLEQHGLDGDRGQRGRGFLGIRYALACWLDEIFVLDSPWGQQWNEQKLEAELYGSNDRAWKFWDQAHRAEQRL